jgi:phosphoglycolate phosphatase
MHMKHRLRYGTTPGIERYLTRPSVILFDWHATLVDTLDAMYHAVDDLLLRLPQLRLIERLVAPGRSKTREDGRLVDYVRNHHRLHPKVKAARRISRTDIFEVLFGDDDEAKRIAHLAFNECYRNHYGEVRPFEGNERAMLLEVRAFHLKLGILEHELQVVENGSWVRLFDTTVCGDDTARHKPAPDPVLRALSNLGARPSPACWYVGDSTTDVICANRAGITSVFFNGAGWNQTWLEKIFPGTPAHPHVPAVIVRSFLEFVALFERCLHIAPTDRERTLWHAHEEPDQSTTLGRP